MSPCYHNSVVNDTTANGDNKFHGQDAAKIIRLHTASLQPLERTVFTAVVCLLFLSAGLVGDISLLAGDNLSKHDHTVTL